LNGLILGAVLIGFVSDYVTSVIDSIQEGHTKVCEEGHTLILGWNQSTIRIVVQIAFLRRAWRMQNETWARRAFPWLRVPPSSPVAKHPVVVLANNMSKAEMDEQLAAAMDARGISSKRTKVSGEGG